MSNLEETTDQELDKLFDRLETISRAGGSRCGVDDLSKANARPDRSRLLDREKELSSAPLSKSADKEDGYDQDSVSKNRKFVPLAPRSLNESGLAESEVEALILKFLLSRGTSTGIVIAEGIAIPFAIVSQLLRLLKEEQLVVLKGSASLNDYAYQLTDLGIQHARRYAQQCSYSEVAPVTLRDYVASVEAQSLGIFRPKLADLQRAFAELTLPEEMYRRLGRAITSGKGLFLFGPPGNGKTSIAERVTKAYGGSIWIPRAISVWGEIIQLYDPSNHEELSLAAGSSIISEEKIDRRWVRIRRPTIVVGGELTMDSLEITANKETGIAEAPLQLKSNCGTLVIDDFGRQQVRPAQLLNRWIVPLEKRHDYLNLISGRKIQVPFDQFVVFSTNLEPRDLVDEAFLRRIPYKIEVTDPTESEFRSLFKQVSEKSGVQYCDEAVDHLLETHYKKTGRKMRFCHPRDLVHQVEIYCTFLETAPELTIPALDAAASDYFAVL